MHRVYIAATTGCVLGDQTLLALVESGQCYWMVGDVRGFAMWSFKGVLSLLCGIVLCGPPSRPGPNWRKPGGPAWLYTLPECINL